MPSFQFYLYGTVLGDEDALNYFNTNYPEWVKQNLFPTALRQTSWDATLLHTMHTTCSSLQRYAI